MVIGLALAVLAAVGFGSGTFVQHRSAIAIDGAPTLNRTSHGLLGLLARLITKPGWLLGQALAGGGSALQFGAMAFAPVAVVQPVIAVGLPIALVLEVARQRRPPAKRLAAGVVLCVSGLIMFVLFSRAGEAREAAGWLVAAVLVGLAAGFALLARFAPGGQIGAALSGVGAGGALGVGAVAASLPIHPMQADGLSSLFTH